MHDFTEKELSSKERKRLRASTFIFPKERRYPIPDIAHGRNALSRVAQHGSPSEKSRVKTAVYRKFPSLKKTSESVTRRLLHNLVGNSKSAHVNESRHRPGAWVIGSIGRRSWEEVWPENSTSSSKLIAVVVKAVSLGSFHGPLDGKKAAIVGSGVADDYGPVGSKHNIDIDNQGNYRPLGNDPMARWEIVGYAKLTRDELASYGVTPKYHFD